MHQLLIRGHAGGARRNCRGQGGRSGLQARRRQRGFSLVEILVAMTVLAILGTMLTRFLVAQSRFTEQQNALRGARMVSRQAMNILESELRMVQDSGGIEVASNDGRIITALVPYRFGLHCGVVGSANVVSMLPVDSLMLAQAVFAGFAWRTRDGAYHNVFTTNPPLVSSNGGQCTGTSSGQAGIRTLTLSGRAGSILEVEPAQPAATMGQPLFFFQRITYEFKASQAFPGTYGLYRTVQGGPSEELMAPFDSSARFKYWKAGAAASVAAAPPVAEIRGLDVVLSAQSTYTPAARESPARSRVIATIFFRNVRKN
jgi:prepilin-type N-terminal cleavage/methylation domain-containing protein